MTAQRSHSLGVTNAEPFLTTLGAPDVVADTAVLTAETALASRLLRSTVQALELYGVYLGKELGLYDALAARGSLTPTELARHTGITPRYAREWLEQQAVAGFLVVDAPSDSTADQRRYRLPAEHVNVLVTEDHPAHLAPLAQMVAGIGGAVQHVLAAYRHGDGVPYPTYGAAFRRGQAGINRPAFLSDLVDRWIPAAADLHERLVSSALRVVEHRPLPARVVGRVSSAAIGTVIRAEAMRELAGAAGFARVDVLPVDAGFFRLYRLSPP